MDDAKKRLVSVFCLTAVVLGCGGYFAFSRDSGAHPDRALDDRLAVHRVVEPVDSPPSQTGRREPGRENRLVGSSSTRRPTSVRRDPESKRRIQGTRKPVRRVKKETTPAG